MVSYDLRSVCHKKINLHLSLKQYETICYDVHTIFESEPDLIFMKRIFCVTDV